jgi:integrase/recombinase XerD
MPVMPVFSTAERLALAGFLAGYSGLTREAYELDLRQYASWCHTRRLCTIAGFSRYAVEEKLLDHSPAIHVRRPRLACESHATALDRNELGALLVTVPLAPRTARAVDLAIGERCPSARLHHCRPGGRRQAPVTRRTCLPYPRTPN